MVRKLTACAALLLASSVSLAASCEYKIEKVAYKNLVANLYLPKMSTRPPVVIAFGGSEGGISTGNSSGELLGPHCIAVLALAYFKEPGLPATLDQIPLEYFIDAIDYVTRLPAIDAGRIGMVAGSRGSEAALLVASVDARIKSVIVATPSEVPWYGQTVAKSAWTWQGKDVPALQIKDDPSQPQIQRFDSALNSVADWAIYRIHVERINGPLFLISAQNDEIWPSTRMSNDIIAYLKAQHFGFPVRHDVYPTGHGFTRDIAPKIKQSVIDRFLETL
jgi:dienelactone hydrolase